MPDEIKLVLDHFSKTMREMGFVVRNQLPPDSHGNTIKEIVLSKDEENIRGQLFIRPRDGALIIQTTGYAREIPLADPDSFQEIEKSFKKLLEIMLLRSLNTPPWKRRK
jgi:hypothetical protein